MENILMSISIAQNDYEIMKSILNYNLLFLCVFQFCNTTISTFLKLVFYKIIHFEILRSFQYQKTWKNLFGVK